MSQQLEKKIPRVLIAGISSGSGKTTLVCAILSELKKRKLRVSACKCGPDYIDPMFHKAVMGAKTANLDLFFSDEQKVRDILYESSKDTNIAVIEGVMGYYDGIHLGKDTASSYDIARKIDSPVILVMSCKGMSLSIAAVVKGVKEFREDSNIQGLVLNGISKALYEQLKPMLENEIHISVVGFLPPLEEFNLESRYLGLITPSELDHLNEQLDYLNSIAKDSLDMEKIIDIANNAKPLKVSKELIEENQPSSVDSKVRTSKSSNKVVIAYAYDRAFCFYYQENMHMLLKMGAKLVPFSPLIDHTLPPDINGLILGGGYPELYAKELAQNTAMLSAVKNILQSGLPCIAECGGFMYLHERMQGKDSRWYNMVGTIKGDSFATERLVRFGYVTLEAPSTTRFLAPGERINGHEFHYWDSTNTGESIIATKASNGKKYNTIHALNNIWAGYLHIYMESNHKFAENFIHLCEERKKGQML